MKYLLLKRTSLTAGSFAMAKIKTPCKRIDYSFCRGMNYVSFAGTINRLSE